VKDSDDKPQVAPVIVQKQKQDVRDKPASSGRQRIYDYVDLYAAVAINEMNRTGIPASIKLAQAILESDAGRSALAVEARNHFGIKCGNTWEGPTYYKKDDDRKKGKLIASCFRSYQDPMQSFLDHSAFLLDPKKNHRYGKLFTYASDDYKKWAKGLQKAGYATNKKYADRLISVIEKYQLYYYDSGKLPTREKPMTIDEHNFHVVSKGDTLYSIARTYNISLDQLKMLNNKKDNHLQIGERLVISK